MTMHPVILSPGSPGRRIPYLMQRLRLHTAQHFILEKLRRFYGALAMLILKIRAGYPAHEFFLGIAEGKYFVN
jgi:hypothetical protein